MRFTYGKKEKLKSKKLIELLFDEGESVSSYPLRMIFLKHTHLSSCPLQVGVSVPKRKVNKAVQRSRIKRTIRESYRLNKQFFYENLNEQYIAMILYTDKEEWKQEALDGKMKKLASKFVERIKESL